MNHVYISIFHNHVVRKISPDGIITTVAGDWSIGDSLDGGLATKSSLNYPKDIDVDDQGNLYIVEFKGTCRVRKVGSDGLLRTVIGCPPGSDCEAFSDGSAATLSIQCDGGLTDIALAPDGSLAFASSWDNTTYCRTVMGRVVQSQSVRRLLNAGEVLFPDENGQGYVMTEDGRHERTIDLATGKTLLTFEYDDNGNLVAQVDRFGDRVTIERDAEGIATAIVSPDSLRTALTHDEDGELTALAWPGGETHTFVYDTGGLLSTYTDPRDNAYTYLYNDYGHVIDAEDPAGGHWQYDQYTTDQGVTTTVLSAEGQLTTYQDSNEGGALKSTITAPDGSVSEYYRSEDELYVSKELSCGTSLDFYFDLDPEYKTPYLATGVTSTESGLSRVMGQLREYLDDDEDGAYDRIVDTRTLNGRTYTVEENIGAGVITAISPEVRVSTETYDTETLLTQEKGIAGLYPTTYAYDSRGRLTAATRGGDTDQRTVSFTYDDNGNLATVTDPLQRVTSFTYDANGRRTGIVRPDSSTIDFSYDNNGNLTSLTVPNASEHTFGYTEVNRNSQYDVPADSGLSENIYHYYYDNDRRPSLHGRARSCPRATRS